MKSNTLEGLKFIMFENKSNNCWLDASMALIAHNKVIKKILNSSPKSKIGEIISRYNKAVSILNDPDINIECNIKAARAVLLNVQISTLQYLQPILKCKVGEPDSAFCALLNLIYESKPIKEYLNISWLWSKQCANCGISSKSSLNVKPIITLSKVNYFLPDCPTSIYVCSCKTEQEMKLIYKELPPCICFHFENGAGNGNKFPVLFTIQDRKYQLTGVIVLEKSKDALVSHFITFIRDPFSDKWLECNDLNMDITTFISKQPQFNVKDVYMYIFESFDNLGKVSNEISTEHLQEHNIENTVELIDLSDEVEEIKMALKNNSENFSAFGNKMKAIETSVANLLLHDCVDNSNQDASKQKCVAMELDESNFTSSQNLKTSDIKNCSNASINKVCADNENTSKSVPDYRTVKISNLRFSIPDRQSSVADIEKQSGSDSESFRKKMENRPESSEIKKDVTCSNYSDCAEKNVSENSKGLDVFLHELCIIRKDAPGNGPLNNAAVDLAFGKENKMLHDDLPKSSEKSNFKSTLSDTSDELCDSQENSSSQKSDLIFNEANGNNFVTSELCFTQENVMKGQLKKNENIIPSEMPQPLLDAESSDYDDHELQLKMQQALLNKNTKCSKKMAQTEANATEPRELPDASKRGADSIDNSASENENATGNQRRNSISGKCSSEKSKKRKWDIKSEKLVHSIVERIFAAFLEELNDEEEEEEEEEEAMSKNT